MTNNNIKPLPPRLLSLDFMRGLIIPLSNVSLLALLHWLPEAGACLVWQFATGGLTA